MTPVRVALLSATAAALIVPPPSRARGAAPLRAVAKEDVVSCLRRESTAERTYQNAHSCSH